MELRSDRRYWFAAPPAAVWAALGALDRYQTWWPWLRGFEAQALAAGDQWRCAVRPPLPYTLSFTIELVTVDEPTTLDARLHGDIDGRARIELDGGGTGCAVHLTSALRPTGRLRWFARAARPVARRGHDWVLDTGASQFAERALTP